MTMDELRAEHKRLTALKAWPAVRRIEEQMKQLQPPRVELMQDAYYYGTAADFTS